MAGELGLGVTPWSPLKGGLLTGKYTRQSVQSKDGRGMFMNHFMNERTFALVDELQKIAQAHDTTAARVALAWLQAQPGVSSTIIGARRLTQLEDNVKALEVRLSAQDLAHLDEKTKPTFGFPATMQPLFPALHNGGTTVNGVHADPLPFGVKKGEKPY